MAVAGGGAAKAVTGAAAEVWACAWVMKLAPRAAVTAALLPSRVRRSKRMLKIPDLQCCNGPDHDRAPADSQPPGACPGSRKNTPRIAAEWHIDVSAVPPE